jgi:integrase
MAATTTRKKKGRARSGGPRQREEAAPRPEGEVIERDWKRGRGFALRFRAYGERRYLTLGFEEDGWDWEKADEELQNVLADVRRGIWVPPQKKKGRRSDGGDAEPGALPLFGPFATDLVDKRKGQVSESTTRGEKWALGHLLPYFGEWPLAEIDVEAVDDYRLAKVRESEDRARAIERGRPRRNAWGHVLRPLAPFTINQTIRYLRYFLATALEYDHVERNVAAGRRRLLREKKKPPVYLDSATHIEVLLEAAAQLDRESRYHCSEREAIIATLIFAGPRAHEVNWMLERDIDLANGRIFIGRSKTSAGLREISMMAILRDILGSHKARGGGGEHDDYAFPTEGGGRRDNSGLGMLLKAVFARAEELLRDRGQQPLPRGLSPHRLRHTFGSILVALGEDPISVMAQLGHTDPSFTMRVYTHLMRRSSEERTRLKALARGDRVVAIEAPAPQPLGSATYELPILCVLEERGGHATRKEVMAAVEKALAERTTAADLERLPSGEVRWTTHFGKAQARLARRGLLFAGMPRGVMELTELGRAEARRSLGQKRARESSESSAPTELEAVG